MAEESGKTADDIPEEEQTSLEAIKKLFCGKWKEVRSENVDEFFRVVGVNFLIRKMVAMVKPEIEVLVEGRDIKILIKLPLKTEVSVFRLNKEMPVENQQGKFFATATFKANKLYISSRPAMGNSARPVDTVREINDQGEFVTTFKVKDTDCVSRRFFVKEKES